MIRVNARLIVLYAFSLSIMYLAGVYFGSFLFVLFLVFLVLPLLSAISFVIWVVGIRFSQDLSRMTPVKGDNVDLILRLRNSAFLPIPQMNVSFTRISDALNVKLEDFATFLAPATSRDITYQFSCPYRGTYRIGVSQLEFADQLRFFRYRKRVEPISVTVYPRVLDIPRFAPVAHDVEGSGRFSSAGILPDTTLFHQLKEYRDGDSIRHIYWKKYASTGKPYLKEYDRTKRAGVRIYLDARSDRRHDVDRLEQEDVSIEALVAIVRYLFLRRVHTTVLAGTESPLVFEGDDLSAFDRFYRHAAELAFYPAGLPPGRRFQADLVSGMLESQTCVFITHFSEPDLFRDTEGSQAFDTIFLHNTAGLPASLRRDFDAFGSGFSRRGRNVISLRSSDHMMEDLTGHSLAFAEGGKADIPVEV